MTNGRKVIRQPLREKSAGEELFDTPFLIETQAYNTIDENFTRIQGEFTTGDPKVDRQMA